MKEIGEALKEARENIGLSMEEVATDLKLRPSQVENIETGNVEAFKDVFYLKSLIRDYAKYLGLDYDEMVDEFNEYLFDHTSRISLDDIKKAKKKAQKKEKSTNRIASPYTMQKRYTLSAKSVLAILVFILIIVGTILLLTNTKPKNNDPKPSDQVIGGSKWIYQTK